MSYSLAFSQAIIILVFVADKVQQGMYEFISTKHLSEALNLSTPTAVKIVQSLNRAGLIETREGAKGGIRLAVPPAEITILDVFTAIEQERPLFQSRLRIRVTGEKPTRAQRSILTVLNNAENAMKTNLQATTIDDLLVEINR